MIRIIIIACASSILLTACVTNRENYIPAGFTTSAEAAAFIPDYLYYAKKLTSNEWSNFYERFPDYWKDIQAAKTIGSSIEFHPWYTAYAFKWNMDRRAKNWDADIISRLRKGDLSKGDDVFKVVYALGPPSRVVWDNDFEVLAYSSGQAQIFESGVFARTASCFGCSARYNNSSREGAKDSDVISALGLKRPSY